MQIATNRLFIRPFQADDAEGLHALLGDEQTMVYLEPAYDLNRTKLFLQTFCIERGGAVGAFHKETGLLIAYILFCAQGKGEYELGWIVNRAYWRQGYAYEACSAVIDYTFTHLHVRRIFAETIDTVKSVALMKKLGMCFDGMQPCDAMDSNGSSTSMVTYSIYRSQWEQHKSAAHS